MKTITEVRDEVIEAVQNADYNLEKNVVTILELWIDSVIENCAESAKLKTDTVLDRNERPWSTMVVDKESILKIKEKLL